MSLYLYLFHGRATPDQDMSDWGAAGPTIGPRSYVHTTYGSEVKIRGSKAVLEKFFPQAEIHFHDGLGEHAIQLAGDCLPHDGKFYGDWSVCTADAMEPVNRNPVTPICDVCGSADLVKDAAAVWDRDRQEWSLLSTYDSTTCQRCEREGDTIERWVPNADAPPADDQQPELDLELPVTTKAEGEGEREGGRG